MKGIRSVGTGNPYANVLFNYTVVLSISLVAKS